MKQNVSLFMIGTLLTQRTIVIDARTGTVMRR